MVGRRHFLQAMGGGFGLIPLAQLLADEQKRHAPKPGLFAPKPTHFKAKADSVIFLFMDGGPSHIDLFDPKPKLNQLAGQKLPESFGRVDTAMGVGNNTLLAAPRKWRRVGSNGLVVSELIPNLGTVADEICLIRSMVADGLNHSVAVSQMNTGDLLAGRPSMGSWISYGLGTINQDLPAFVVICDDQRTPPGGIKNWGAGFMPSVYQGTRLQNGSMPIVDLEPPKEIAGERAKAILRLTRDLNVQHQSNRADDDRLEARIASFELAARMQLAAPDIFDLNHEKKAAREAYGLNHPKTAKMARSCLLAKRLNAAGVRFVQVYCGSGCQWDAHEDIEANHRDRCAEMDQPVAALLKDLRRTGQLDRTLVIWGGEFGRTPMSELGKGRDHNPYGFSMFLAGAGIKPGTILGATDELGLRAIEDKVHVHDLHATILHLLGLDHLKLTFNDHGREQRLTIDAGKLVNKVLA